MLFIKETGLDIKKNRGRCSNENMEVSGQRKIGRSKRKRREVIQKSTERRSTRQKNSVNENSMRVKPKAEGVLTGRQM